MCVLLFVNWYKISIYIYIYISIQCIDFFPLMKKELWVRMESEDLIQTKFTQLSAYILTQDYLWY